MEIFYSILGLVGVALIIFFAIRAKKNRAEKRNLNRLPVTLPASFAYKYDTPDAPYVSSVVPVPQEALDAVKAGIELQIRATQALFPHWDKVRTPYDYNVMFIEPDATTQEGYPALWYQVKNAEMEVVNRIKTAGTVIGTGEDNIQPTNIVLPHQAVSNWQYLDYLRDASRFESEHFAELFNDMAMFKQYATSGDVHPHHPLPEESANRIVGFKSSEPAYVDSCLSVDGEVEAQEGRGGV